MQRILNNPDNIVDEMLQGFLKAHSDLVEGGENPRVVKVKNIPEGKVGVITGGGSGHKPAFIGYVSLRCSSSRGNLFFPYCSSISGCGERSRSGKRRCLPLWKLFWRQHECKNGCEDGKKSRNYC